MEKFLYNPKKCEVGFTLIEQLISLMVLTIIIMLVVPIAFNRMNDINEQQFLKVLSNDILYIQNMAINYPETYTRIWFRENDYVIVGGYLGNVLTRRTIPDNWKITRHSLGEISFNKAGTIRQPGSLRIETPTNTYKVVFPLGKGREYIVKK